jgi:spermidine synthase/Flp pilus assembly protein TadD
VRVVYLLYCLSGFVSLCYQVAWFRIFVDRFGSTNLTFALVICNFIGGLGAGSLASRRIVAGLERVTGLKHPLRTYGAVEMLIVVTALLTLVIELVPADVFGAFPYRLEGGVHRPTAAYAAAQVGIGAMCMFLPCLLMGATFPLLCSAFRAEARFPSALYGWNTLGACAGVLACEFLLLPRLGHDRTYLTAAGINLALGAYFLLRPGPQPHAEAPREEAAERRAAGVALHPPSVILACAILSGFLTGAFEADVLRRLQFLDCRSDVAMSSISFWAILAIFLASWTVRALSRLTLRWIQAAYVLAFACYALTWRCAYPLRDRVNAADLERVQAALPHDATGLGISFQFFPFGYGLGAVLLFTGLFVFPAFYLLSLLLPHVCNAAQAERRHLGRVYGANTLAFCAGMLAFTVGAPRVDVIYSLKLFLLFFALAAASLLAITPARPLAPWKPGLAALLLVVLTAATPAGFDADYLPADSPASRYPVRALRSNGVNTTYIVEEPAGDLLFFDSHSMSGCNPEAQQYMRLMAHFPLLAHPAPERALLICFGVGATASAIARHDTIERLDIVELNDQVLATAPEFAAVNRDVVHDPRVRLIHDDGRRFLAFSGDAYDLITSEPPPPMFAGVYRLYSREYYAAARAHLTPGGLMSQWLPIGQMPRAAMDQAIATFVQVFPESLLFVGSSTNYILVGSNAPIDLATLERRLAASDAVLEDLRTSGVERPVSLLARIVKCGPTLLREFGDAPAISDQNNPLSHAFHDPRDPAVITYDPRALLDELGVERLACGAELARVVRHLGRLKSMVRDFPAEALMSVRTAGRDGVALADVDWRAVDRLLVAAGRAMAEQRSGEASAHLQRALGLAGELPFALHWLGMMQNQSGRLDEALRTWEQLLALEPQDPDAHYGAGWALMKLARHEEAIGRLRRAIELDARGNVMYRRSLGDALALARRFEEAIRAYDDALTLAPGDQAVMANKQRCLEQLGR